MHYMTQLTYEYVSEWVQEAFCATTMLLSSVVFNYFLLAYTY